MKVLLVSPLPPPSGGIATWTKEVSEFFNDQQSEVSIDVLNTSLTGKRSGAVSNKRSLLDEAKRTGLILQQLRKILNDNHYDAIHINSSGAQFGMYRDAQIAKVAHKKGIPVALQFRCNTRDQAEYNRISKRGFARLIRYPDLIMVLNKGSYNHLIENTQHPVHILPNFTSMPLLDHEKMISEDIRSAIYVGQVRSDKGIMELLETAVSFPEIVFHLYGNIDEEYTGVKVPQNVILHGNAEKGEIQQALDAADLFVLPSYTEGFSNALAEAMARAMPCIATEVGANNEMLSDNCGICIPAHDSVALIKAVQSARDKEYRRSLSGNALNKCRNQYAKEKVCDLLKNEWQTIMNSGDFH